MKKLIILAIAVAAVCFAEDIIVSIAQPNLEQSFTNTTIDQVWYPKAGYFVQSVVSNNTISLKKVSNGVDITVDSASVTTAVDSELVVPAQVRVGKGEIIKITRSHTNGTLKGFITISGQE
jgi:hypothetical protein